MERLTFKEIIEFLAYCFFFMVVLLIMAGNMKIT